jgi:nucleoid-associated protein YgaU
MALLRQENAILGARLRQAQGTLDQIANVARMINNGGASGAGSPPLRSSQAPTSSAAPGARIHVVHDGDSLTRISLFYYGTTGRWQEIYAANREVLQGENALVPGQRLRIP